MAVTALGILVVIGGAVSIVANTFAAVEERPFTVSLGGLLVGLGGGLAVAGVLLLRGWEGHPVGVRMCAGIIAVATVAGYVAGGVLDNPLR